MKSKITVASLLLFLCVYACQQAENSESKAVKEDSQMAQATAMQMGMRAMESEMKVIKEKLINGDSLNSSDFRVLNPVFTAESSEDVNDQEKFKTHTKAFLESYGSIQSAIPDERTMLFNTAVDNCITCHKSYCPGPVKRIAKLKI